MKVVELKCPHCGAPIPRETLRCNYCGTHVIFLQNGSLTMKKTMNCPKCENPCEQDSWFCINCGTILTEDPEELGILKELQRKLKFKQESVRELLPKEIKREMEPNEYVHFYYKAVGTPHAVVTEKRILQFDTGWFIKRENWKKAPWSEVVSISEPIGLPLDVWQLRVTTFDETFTLVFKGIADTVKFHSFCVKALANHNLRKRAIEAKICSLPLDEVRT